MRSPADVLSHIEARPRFAVEGRIRRVVGLVAEATGLDSAPLGCLCQISSPDGKHRILADVVGFDEGKSLLMPYGEMHGITPGAGVRPLGIAPDVGVGEQMLGRIINGLGEPIDQGGPIHVERRMPLHAPAPNPLTRAPIDHPFETGVRSIDGLLTLGRGQRIGIFAGAGVGKSTLLGMMARNSEADINVIALLGERGKEVPDFIRKTLGPEGLARSVVVVVTGDESALLRVRGAYVATAVAEYFRSQGKNVLLVLDSLTRVCMAQREIGLAVGESPARGGYPPSALAGLPRLLERAGNSERGSITGLYTVLVDGDDMTEPVSAAVQSIVDGHLVLTRKIAESGVLPAIDVLGSVSRVRDEVITPHHREAANLIARVEAEYRDKSDFIAAGVYKVGSSPETDAARAVRDVFLAFLRQEPGEATPLPESIGFVSSLSAELLNMLAQSRGGNR